MGTNIPTNQIYTASHFTIMLSTITVRYPNKMGCFRIDSMAIYFFKNLSNLTLILHVNYH